MAKRKIRTAIMFTKNIGNSGSKSFMIRVPKFAANFIADICEKLFKNYHISVYVTF